MAEDWRGDPMGLHEARMYSNGNPSDIVRNGAMESLDPMPRSAAPDMHVPVDATTPIRRRRLALAGLSVAGVIAVIAVASLGNTTGSAVSKSSIGPQNTMAYETHPTTTTVPPTTTTLPAPTTTEAPPTTTDPAAYRQAQVAHYEATVTADQAAVQQDQAAISSLGSQQTGMNTQVEQLRMKEQAAIAKLERSGQATKQNLANVGQQSTTNAMPVANALAGTVAALTAANAKYGSDTAQLNADQIALQVAIQLLSQP